MGSRWYKTSNILKPLKRETRSPSGVTMTSDCSLDSNPSPAGDFAPSPGSLGAGVPAGVGGTELGIGAEPPLEPCAKSNCLSRDWILSIACSKSLRSPPPPGLEGDVHDGDRTGDSSRGTSTLQIIYKTLSSKASIGCRICWILSFLWFTGIVLKAKRMQLYSITHV